MNNQFRVIFLEEAKVFLDNLESKAREKILLNIRKSVLVNDPELFKKLTIDIWEFRTFYNKTKYRLFAFWDKTDTNDTLVVSAHGIIKKTAKVPRKEIAHAIEMRKSYFNQK